MSRRKREREAPEVGAMAGRVVRALVRRAAEGDTEALEQLLALQAQIAQAVNDAGRALHDEAGYSFTYLAGVAGVSRQAARERFGSPVPRATDTTDTPTAPSIQRVDRYTVQIDGHGVRATADQERRLRELDPDAISRFKAIMGVAQ